jgi:hypothetical protein
VRGWLSTEGVRTGRSRSTGGRRPDLRGGLTIEGREFLLSGWTSADGKRISIRVTEREKGETILANIKGIDC